MRVGTLFCLLVFLLPFNLAAQSDSTQNQYYRTFSDYFFLGPVIKKRDLIFHIISRENPKSDITFKPNSSYSVGLNVNLFDLNLEASVSVPVGIKSIGLYGESQVKDIQFGALTNKFVLDTYWQKYSGFYYKYPTLFLSSNQPFPQRADVDTRNMGVYFSYVFNHKKFSLRSAYTFLDQQLKSKGSFLLGFIVSSFDVRADSALVSKKFHSVDLQSDMDAARISSFGLAPGYSYNVVYNKFFLNLTLNLGPAHYWTRYHNQEEGTHYAIEINTYSAFRVALGYNGDRFFSGINFSAQGRNAVLDGLKLANSISTFRFTLGYRFKESGLLKKRATDYVPVLLK